MAVRYVAIVGLPVHSSEQKHQSLAGVSSPAAVRCGGMHVCPSFSVQVAAVQCPPSPSPSGRTAGSALVVHSVPGHKSAAARSLLARGLVARTAAGHMAVACCSVLVVVVGRELVDAGNNRLATATALQKLVRMARALLVDATRTAYGLFGDAHLLVWRKAKRSAGQSAS